MFLPIRAVCLQQIGSYAHLTRPGSAYKEPCVFNCYQYLLIYVYMCKYPCISVHIQQLPSTLKWATKEREHTLSRHCLYWSTHNKGPFTLALSHRSDVMVCWPDHGPRVDVKEAAAWSRLAIPVTEPMLIALWSLLWLYDEPAFVRRTDDVFLIRFLKRPAKKSEKSKLLRNSAKLCLKLIQSSLDCCSDTDLMVSDYAADSGLCKFTFQSRWIFFPSHWSSMKTWTFQNTHHLDNHSSRSRHRGSQYCYCCLPFNFLRSRRP